MCLCVKRTHETHTNRLKKHYAQGVLRMLLGLVKDWSWKVAAEAGLSRNQVSPATLKTFGSYHLG